MKALVSLSLVFSALCGFVAVFYVGITFVAPSNFHDTVWQQVVGGTAATTFALGAVGFILGAILVVLWNIMNMLEAIRWNQKQTLENGHNPVTDLRWRR